MIYSEILESHGFKKKNIIKLEIIELKFYVKHIFHVVY